MGSDLAEVQNVVDVTFGNMAGAADEWAQSAITAFGMSEKVAKQYLGTTGAMSKAFGFSTQEALEQAKGVAGLAGDVASFYNLSTDEAYSKLKAIYTGETEGLKSLGVVMTQSALDQFALAKGYGKTTAKMSEQEKVALRYAFVMDKLSAAQGDFTRTQDGWANQTRVLKLRFDALKATLGQGFINILTPVVKWLNSLLEKLMLYAEVFKQFTASVFGDAGSAGEAGSKAFSSAAESTDNATEVAKKYKKAIMGFDELNILSTGDNSDDESSSFAAGFDDVGAASEKSMSETERRAAAIVEKLKEMLGINGKITSWADFFKTKIGKILKIVGEIGLALLGWKVGKKLVDFITKTDWKAVGKEVAGIAGAFLTTDGITTSLEDGISWKSAGETVVGGALLGYSIGGGTGALVGTIIGIAVDAIIGIVQSKDTWLHWKWVESLTDALADALVWCEDAVSNAGKWITEAVHNTTDWICTAWGNTIAFFKGIWDGVKNVFKSVGSWFSNIFTGAWNGIKEAFSAVGSFFTGVWNTIKSIFTSIGVAIGNAVSGAFKKAVNALIGFAQGTINGFIKAINWAIETINKIPGVEIKKLNLIDIPMLANGGYVAANTPQLAIIGDNRHEGEIVAPESKIAEAVAKGMRGESDTDFSETLRKAIIEAFVQVYSTMGSASGGDGDTEVNVYIGNKKIEDMITEVNKKKLVRSGGRA